MTEPRRVTPAVCICADDDTRYGYVKCPVHAARAEPQSATPRCSICEGRGWNWHLGEHAKCLFCEGTGDVAPAVPAPERGAREPEQVEIGERVLAEMLAGCIYCRGEVAIHQAGDIGPFCETCWEKLRVQFEATRD